MHPADSSVTHTGENPFAGMRKLDLPGVVNAFFAQAWLMFLSAVPTSTLNAHASGNS
jgi:hypothetical protein